jgi:hypothetical protein
MPMLCKYEFVLFCSIVVLVIILRMEFGVILEFLTNLKNC